MSFWNSVPCSAKFRFSIFQHTQSALHTYFSIDLEHQHHSGSLNSLNSGISVTSLLDTDHIIPGSPSRALGDLSNCPVARAPSPQKRKHVDGVGGNHEDSARQKEHKGGESDEHTATELQFGNSSRSPRRPRGRRARTT